jgi:hypothetical protein
MPIQNDGADRDVDPGVLFQGQIAPSGMPIEIATTVASTAISNGIASRATISVVTGLPDHIDVPKSRRKKPQTKSGELH